MNDLASPPARLLLDVTQTSVTPHISGVQRAVRDFARDNANAVLLVRQHPRHRGFVFVPRIPELRTRRRRGPVALLRRALRRLFLFVSQPWRDGRREGSPLLFPVRTAARRLYLRHLSETSCATDRRLTKRPTWTPTAGDVLLVMEIPREPKHVAGLLAVAVESPADVVTYVHDLIPIRFPTFFAPENRSATRRDFLRYLDVVERSQRVVANSHATALEFQQWLTLARGAEAPSPLVSYPPIPKIRTVPSLDGSDARKRPGCRTTLRILGIGALDRRKNFRVAVQAVALLQESGQAVQFTLVSPKGRAEELDTLRGIEGLGDAVTLRDGVSDGELEALYHASDVVVVPSRAEGFGLPVIESLVRGRPVVASRIPVFAELGELLPLHLADPDDAAEWAEQIRSAASAGPPEFDASVLPTSWVELSNALIRKGTARWETRKCA